MNQYDFDLLIEKLPELRSKVVLNKSGGETINFSDSLSVRLLNKALLFSELDLHYWDFPESNLTPAYPSRLIYLELCQNLYEELFKTKPTQILDIGCGANLIYALIATKKFGWHSTGADIDYKSLEYAQNIIDENKLNSQIDLRHQSNSKYVLNNLVLEKDSFDLSVCNPPFYSSSEEASRNRELKVKNLKIAGDSNNFQGKNNELWCSGGELSFVKNYIRESQFYKTQIKLFSSLISNGDNIRPLKVALKKLGARCEVKKIKKGNKLHNFIFWSFQ
jgi:23S rRNA (adenine1618-N6)-methyltransferase